MDTTKNTWEHLRSNIDFIEEKIGYKFRDKNLLLQAFTSKSFGAENPDFADNDILEFYGDAELYKFMSDWLYDSFTVYPDGKQNNQLTSKKKVGTLSEIRKNYIKKESLARCLRMKQLDQFILLGKSDLNNNSADSDSILEDVFEAIIGAVKADTEKQANQINYFPQYNISNQYETIKKVCHNLYEMYDFEKDYVNEIYEFCNDYGVEPSFRKSGYSSPVTCRLEIPDLNIYSEGKGKSFEVAKMEACKNAMDDCNIYDMRQEVGEPEFDKAVSQLNMLYQKGYITKPDYKFKNETQEDGRQLWTCYCYITTYEDKEDYNHRGIGKEYSKSDSKKAAAYDMLYFIFNETPEQEQDSTWTCPYCGAENSSESNVCQTCFDEGD